MHQTDNNASTDLFLTKACEEVWSQRVEALAPGLPVPLVVFDASAFCLALSNGRVVFGMVLHELSDSYLVAMPAILVNDDGVIRGKSMVSEPLIRIFKSNMLFYSSCSEKHLPAYHLYLYERVKLLQGLVRQEALKEIEASAKEYLIASSMAQDVATADSDDSDEEEDSQEQGLRSTIGMYYNRTTRH